MGFCHFFSFWATVLRFGLGLGCAIIIYTSRSIVVWPAASIPIAAQLWSSPRTPPPATPPLTCRGGARTTSRRHALWTPPTSSTPIGSERKSGLFTFPSGLLAICWAILVMSCLVTISLTAYFTYKTLKVSTNMITTSSCLQSWQIRLFMVGRRPKQVILLVRTIFPDLVTSLKSQLLPNSLTIKT